MWATLASILWLALHGPDRTDEVWRSLTEISLALIGWAGGPRIFKYVASMRRTPGADPESTGITPGDSQ
jgi:hypothetical protein